MSGTILHENCSRVLQNIILTVNVFTKIDCNKISLSFLNNSTKNISEKASVAMAKIIRHMIGFEEISVDLRSLVKVFTLMSCTAIGSPVLVVI